VLCLSYKPPLLSKVYFNLNDNPYGVVIVIYMGIVLKITTPTQILFIQYPLINQHHLCQDLIT